MKLGRLARRLESLVLTIFSRELRNANAMPRTPSNSRPSASPVSTIRSDLESPAAAFYTRQLQHKKVAQVAIDKDFYNETDARDLREQSARKIRSGLHADQLIHSAVIVGPGRRPREDQLKLEHAQQTVQINERDFANFSNALQDTVHK